MLALRLAVVALVVGTATTNHSSLPYVVRSAAADTVDVPVGSPVLDTKGMQAFTTHLIVHRVGTETPQQEATNTITFADSAGRAITRVSSIGQAMGPNGKVSVSSYFTFDRKTLALLSTRSVSPRGEMSVRVNGQAIEVTMPSPNGPQQASMQMATPGFFAAWSDFVVEELPRREGAVYRVPLWQPGLQPGAPPRLVEETHIYTVRGREEVTVLGKTIPRAWVVEDRVAGRATPAGTMWIVDGAPKLVRWDTNGPDGSPTTRIEQELVGTP